MEMNNKNVSTEKKRMWLALIPTIVMVALMWLFFIVSHTHLINIDMFRLGILPRRADGLVGIIFSPLVHSSVSHLLSNTLPILILVWSLFYFYNQIAFKSLIVLWLMSGFFTWIIGRESYHVGASGLIFSLAFFLFFSGIFRRYIPLIAVSLVVAFVYGSTVWSIFPFASLVDADISWEGHLAGTISGFILAVVLRNKGPQRPVKEWDEDVREEENEADSREIDQGGDDGFFLEN